MTEPVYCIAVKDAASHGRAVVVPLVGKELLKAVMSLRVQAKRAAIGRLRTHTNYDGTVVVWVEQAPPVVP